MQSNPVERAGYLQVFIGAAIWGTIGFFVMVMSRYGSSAVLTSFLRLLFAALIMVALTGARYGLRSLVVDRKTLGICALLGLICQGINNIFYCEAIVQAGVTPSAVLINTAPVFAAVEAHLLFHEEISRHKVLPLAADVAGCILAVTGGHFDTGTLSVTGILYGIGSGICYSLTSVIGKIAGARTNAFVMSTYSYVFSALFLLFFLKPQDYATAAQAPLLGVAFLYALVPTALAYAIYFLGVQKIRDNSIVPVIASVETVVAALLGVLLFREIPDLVNILGILLVLSSIYLLSRR